MAVVTFLKYKHYLLLWVHPQNQIVVMFHHLIAKKQIVHLLHGMPIVPGKCFFFHKKTSEQNYVELIVKDKKKKTLQLPSEYFIYTFDKKNANLAFIIAFTNLYINLLIDLHSFACSNFLLSSNLDFFSFFLNNWIKIN